MWTGVPCHIKYKSSLSHQSVYNCVMPSYVTALMMTGSKVSKDPKNKLINPWPERKPMALDYMGKIGDRS